jgi:carbon monoxide dehydrogenase subunit G
MPRAAAAIALNRRSVAFPALNDDARPASVQHCPVRRSLGASWPETTMTFCRAVLSCICCMLLAAPAFGQDAGPQYRDADIVVNVSKVEDDIILEGTFVVAATLKEVWAVMLDYDHMAEFLENIDESRIVQKSENRLIVFQRGRATLGLFWASFESTRQVDLIPMREIRSHIIGGNIVKSNGHVVLESTGAETKVIYRNETIPNVYAPFALSRSSIEAQVRRQFQLIRAEIMRRKGLPRKPE